MNRKAFWISYALGVIVAAGSIFWGIRNASSLMAPDNDLAAMQFTDLDGKLVDISGFYDKPLVVNYWATWCKPCLEEFPGFERVKQQYAGKVHFVMVSDEETGKVTKFKNKNNYSFNFFITRQTFAELGMNAVPVTYVYETGGALLRKQAGTMEAEELVEWIEKAL